MWYIAGLARVYSRLLRFLFVRSNGASKRWMCVLNRRLYTTDWNSCATNPLTDLTRWEREWDEWASERPIEIRRNIKSMYDNDEWKTLKYENDNTIRQMLAKVAIATVEAPPVQSSLSVSSSVENLCICLRYTRKSHKSIHKYLLYGTVACVRCTLHTDFHSLDIEMGNSVSPPIQ